MTGSSMKMMTAAEFAALADKQVGKPYVLGAEASVNDSNPPKFDCSELVEWLYGRNGTPIGDLAASQYDRTVPVSGSPKVGDLVFLKNNPARWNNVGHVAILTSKLSNGDWRVIEARGRAWGVVRSTLSYWKSRKYYAGLRRFKGFALQDNSPVIPINDLMRVGSWNTEYPAWGGNSNFIADGKFIRDKMRCSIVFLQEADEKNRNAIRSVLGSGRYKVWPTGLVSVMFDSSKYRYGDHSAISFGTLANRAMKVEFFSKENGEQFYAASIHVRANAAFPASWTKDRKLAEKQKDVKRIIEWLKGHKNVVVGGDWNTEMAMAMMKSAGYRMCTPNTKTNKDGCFDAIYVKGDGMFVRNINAAGKDPGSVLNSGKYSDHLAVVANVTRGSDSAN